MRGVTSLLGWKHSSHLDTATTDADDNPFAGPKQQPVRKISMNMLTDDWLCKKMDKLNCSRRLPI